ncbi:MAG TPA: hypothetical protein VEQ63_11640, partial [Bryobacteraceae bacterium]|nr:hypothetical protein [Bryobacteraceae bacterium]
MSKPLREKFIEAPPSRRAFVGALASAVTVATVQGQGPAPQNQTPPTSPAISPDATPRDWSGNQPVRYPDPDIIALDNRFRKYIIGN